MPSYVVTVAAVVGLALFIQTTPVQQQSIAEGAVTGTAQTVVVASVASVSAASPESMTASASTATVMDIVRSTNARKKMIIAQMIGAFAIGTLLLFLVLSLVNVISFAIWLPAIPPLIGLLAVAGANFVRLERQYQSASMA